MFDKLYTSSQAINRHMSAPYAQERILYLNYCQQRGDSPSVVLAKASDLLWIIRRLSAYSDLHLTIEQIRKGVVHKDDSPRRRRRLIDTACSWLKYLDCIYIPEEKIPFQLQLDEYIDWAINDRGLSEASVCKHRFLIKHYLKWYGTLGRPLSDVQINDCDTYIRLNKNKWCRISVCNVVKMLKEFFRYGASQGLSITHK